EAFAALAAEQFIENADTGCSIVELARALDQKQHEFGRITETLLDLLRREPKPGEGFGSAALARRCELVCPDAQFLESIGHCVDRDSRLLGDVLPLLKRLHRHASKL